jgi:hypothetical protein
MQALKQQGEDSRLAMINYDDANKFNTNTS